MDGIRYIHAADLHLDTPFQGLSRTASQGAHLARLLQEATFKAMERLFRLCESDKPDFLILAGDVYNEENHSEKPSSSCATAAAACAMPECGFFLPTATTIRFLRVLPPYSGPTT